MASVLGIDCSTQSLTGTLMELDTGAVFSHSISYTQDKRLARFAILNDTCTIAPRVTGEADQPPLMYLQALDCLFDDLDAAGHIDLTSLTCINISAQQHAQVYLANTNAFSRLHTAGTASLAGIFADSFSYKLAPIWMTSNTTSQRNAMIDAYDGDIRSIIGSDLALRYSGVVIKRIAEQFPEAYAATKRIHLVSSFLTGVLCGNPDAPIDIGNGAGTGLMHFTEKAWDPKLFAACTDTRSLSEKLPPLDQPQSVVGKIARYFIQNHGIAEDCQILAGSGDNCQTKSMIDGSLLSLGSSFVVMSDVTLDDKTRLPDGLMNMYDGFGRPFTMVCKTNGALVWDLFRQGHSYREAEEALHTGRFTHSEALVYRPIPETFPNDPMVYTTIRPHFASYPRIVESSLAELASAWLSIYSKPELLYVSGGPATSHEILLRVSALWDCPVRSISDVGASRGAALVAAHSVATQQGAVTPIQFPSDEHTHRIEADSATKEKAQRLLRAFA